MAKRSMTKQEYEAYLKSHPYERVSQDEAEAGEEAADGDAPEQAVEAAPIARAVAPKAHPKSGRRTRDRLREVARGSVSLENLDEWDDLEAEEDPRPARRAGGNPGAQKAGRGQRRSED